MSHTGFKIDGAIFERFPGLFIGVVVAKGINNGGSLDEIQKSIIGYENAIRGRYTPDALPLNPKIEAWRKAYAAFGAKPKDNRSSVENLYCLVLQGISIRHINSLVDIYNLISLKYMLPVGGEDLDKVVGDILLTFAGPNESAVLLLGDKEPRPPHHGEVIYKDDVSAICRRFNWREADRTKLTEETKNCILVVEGIPPVMKEEVDAAAKELKSLVQAHCGGKVTYAILEKNNPSIEL